MSADSSDSASRRQTLVKRVRQLLTPRQDWGIVVGVLGGLLALFAPWFLLTPLFAAVFPYMPVGSNVKVALATGVAMVAGFGIIAAALMAYNRTFKDIGVGKLRLKHAGYAFVALLLYIATSLTLHTVVQAVFGEHFKADEVQDLGYSSALQGFELAAAFVCLVVIAPITEEIIFRGFMFKGIRRHLPFVVTALAVSGIFGLVHGQWNVGLDVFAMSMISCYLVEKTRSLWPSIFLHVLKNGVAFSLVYLFAGSL